MLALELESTVQLPRLPLARTVMRMDISLQDSGIRGRGGVARWLTEIARIAKIAGIAKI
jgi:hypothetical protein